MFYMWYWDIGCMCIYVRPILILSYDWFGVCSVECLFHCKVYNLYGFISFHSICYFVLFWSIFFVDIFILFFCVSFGRISLGWSSLSPSASSSLQTALLKHFHVMNPHQITWTMTGLDGMGMHYEGKRTNQWWSANCFDLSHRCYTWAASSDSTSVGGQAD